MGLNEIDRLSDGIRGAVRGIFRISIIKRTVDTGLAFIQAFGHGDPDDPTNQELLQEADIDHVQHYGLETSPPVDVDVEGIVAEVDGGETCIAERFNMEDLDTHGTADEMPARAKGDTVLYSKDGTYIYLDADGKLTIKAMTDNVEIITEAGKQVKLGQNGATYRDIAYAHNTAAGASQVAARIEFETWTDEVKDDMAAIKADLDGLRANMLCVFNNAADIATVPGSGPVNAVCVGPHVITLPPNTTTRIDEDQDFAYVSSGSTKAEVEP